MYVAGIGAIGLFLGLFPCWMEPVDAEMWHIVIGILIALFSVPTVLLISVLRTTTKSKKSAEAESLHAAIGEKIVKVVEKWVEKE